MVEGSVGIGTTSPQTTLSLQNTSGSTGITVTTPSLNSHSQLVLTHTFYSPANTLTMVAHGEEGGSILGIDNRENNFLYSTGVNNNNTMFAIGTRDVNDLIFGTNDAERMRITSTGNVGIGTTSPASANGADVILNIAGRSNGVIPSLVLTPYTGQGNAHEIRSYQGILRIYNGTTEQLQINNAGNVGIGTTVPNVKLQVQDGRIRAAGNMNAIENGSGWTGKGVEIGYDGGSDYGSIIAFDRSAGTYKKLSLDGNPVILGSSGNVGIGTTSPGNLLEVRNNKNNTGYDDVLPLRIYTGAGYIWIGSENPSYAHFYTDRPNFYMNVPLVQGSSRKLKSDIRKLTTQEALRAVKQLEPVRYRYKSNNSDEHVGFVAEDVPDLLNTPDRDGLSAMDIVAALTKVVQYQQEKIEALEERLNDRQ